MKIMGSSVLLLLGCLTTVAQTNGVLVTNTSLANTQSEGQFAATDSHTGGKFVALSTNLFAREASADEFSPVFQHAGQEPEGKEVAFAGEIKAQPLMGTPSHDQAFDHLSLSYFERPFEQQTYDRLDRAGYFDRPELPSDSLLTRIGQAFEPEPIHLGKATMTCSIWTAIKRKNPLALINPLVVDISW